MDKDEALDLALETLESIQAAFPCETVGKRITAIKRARALDKMADNARELGLMPFYGGDYEPADGTQVSKVWWDGEKLMAKPIFLEDMYLPAPVQEPVAYWIPKAEQFCIADPSGRPFAKAWEPLYTTPPAAQTAVPLTDKQKEKLWCDKFDGDTDFNSFCSITEAIEAAHGITAAPEKGQS